MSNKKLDPEDEALTELLLDKVIQNKGTISIKIESADIWDAGWTTYRFYYMVDTKKIPSINEIKVVKGKGCLDLVLVLALISAGASTISAYPALKEIISDIVRYLKRRQRRKRNKNQKTSIEGKEIKSD